MIDIDKYQGHTEGKWEYVDATIHATARGGNEVIAEYPYWNYNKDRLITKEEEANLLLMTDAPKLLAEVKRMYEFRDRVLAAFVKMSRNSRSLTELLNWLGYCDYYSYEDYLMGLHPHSLGLYELKDEWMEKAQQYLESEE
jgi:hypothetical protein